MKRFSCLSLVAIYVAFVGGCGSSPPQSAAPAQPASPPGGKGTAMAPRRPVQPSEVQFERGGRTIDPSTADPESVEQHVGAWRERFEAENQRWAAVQPVGSKRPYVSTPPTRQPDPASEEDVPAPRRAPREPAAEQPVASNAARVSPRPMARPSAQPLTPSVPTPGNTTSEPTPVRVTPPATRPVPPTAVPPTSPEGPAIGRPIDPTPTVTQVSTDPDALLKKLQERVRINPQDLAAHFDLQMFKLVREDRVPATDLMSGLTREDREILIALADGMSVFRSAAKADGSMLPSQKVRPILDMADRIRAQAELSIPTLSLCSRVSGFGVYDPMPTTFRAGQDVPVIVYCEVANFSSRLNAKDMWETRLSMGVVLYMQDGTAIWNSKNDVPADMSRNRRHDFFVVKRVTLPKTMAPGRYVLKVTISDDQANRVAENSVEITMVANP